ncbi:hypothetical protein ABZ419_09660 [Streptomyces cinnamoneus]|uniref:hypothetical protein n=1 Tax=Streptomyces cinnamoneus TaxID=53446 RepID=UPI0033FB335D
MAPKSKIRDEAELLRWFDAGMTYKWMAEQYLAQYNEKVSPSLFASYRSRKGLEPRLVKDPELVPWGSIQERHWWKAPLTLLRIEARRRRKGADALTGDEADRNARWLKWMAENNAVVYYDPDTEEGFHYVPRTEQDTDLARKP